MHEWQLGNLWKKDSRYNGWLRRIMNTFLASMRVIKCYNKVNNRL